MIHSGNQGNHAASSEILFARTEQETPVNCFETVGQGDVPYFLNTSDMWLKGFIESATMALLRSSRGHTFDMTSKISGKGDWQEWVVVTIFNRITMYG